jgi:hypothetical protein
VCFSCDLFSSLSSSLSASKVLITEFANDIDNPKAVLHLSEPSSATVIRRLNEKQEAQLAADAAMSQQKLPPFWSEPGEVISHSAYKPPPGADAAGGNSHKSEAVDRLLATLEQAQHAAPPSRALVATLKGLAPFIPLRNPASSDLQPHAFSRQVLRTAGSVHCLGYTFFGRTFAS